jgi:tRNA modification GTPase
VLAHVEAYIDFPDEDLPAQDRAALLTRLDELLAGTKRLLATSHYGELLRDGIKTVILGETNAGKSSVLNRLVGRDRALVSPEPGTTRDYIEERTIIGGHCLRLIDTAGLNSNASPLDRRGIDKTLEQAAAGDLFLWIIDSTRAPPALPPALVSVMTSGNTIAVFNKSDLLRAAFAPSPHAFASLFVSALTGEGFAALQEQLAAIADSFRTEIGDELIAINARHARSLSEATASIAAAREKIEAGSVNELTSSDLRCSLVSFEEISGRIDNEKMLDLLFCSFCIGK